MRGGGGDSRGRAGAAAAPAHSQPRPPSAPHPMLLFAGPVDGRSGNGVALTALADWTDGESVTAPARPHHRASPHALSTRRRMPSLRRTRRAAMGVVLRPAALPVQVVWANLQ